VEGPQETASATPILDAGVMPPRHRGIRPLALLAALLVGVVLMESLALAGGLWHENWPAIFLLLFLLAVAVHEVGHLLAGWAAGFHFNSIQVGPLPLEDEYGFVKAHFSLDVMYLGYAGMYANTVRKLRRRLLIYIAGGPSANLLSVLAVVLISHLMPVSDSGLATAAGQFGAISLLLAMVSLLPVSSSDGALIEMLLFSPFSARRFISTVALGAQFKQGIRARHWKQSWIKAATGTPDKSGHDFYASWMGYLSASDRKDDSVSAQYLERCLSITPILTNRLRSLVAQEASVHAAWVMRDPRLADKWLAQVKSRPLLPPIVQARIEVALNCARSDFDKAAVAYEKGLKLFQKMPMKPHIRVMKESWVEWWAEIEQQQTHPVVSQLEEEQAKAASISLTADG